MMTKVEKHNKILFYIKGYSTQFLPKQNLEKKINALRKTLSNRDLEVAEYRVDYYNKLSEKQKVTHSGTQIKDLKHPKTPKSYYFDTYEYARYFDENLLIDYAFGDVNTILPIPMITKSRPIAGNNENNILLNLDKARHFVSVNDSKSFDSKTNKLIGRAAVHQQHRIDFFNQYFENPLCDLGQVNKSGGDQKWLKPKISIDEHLKNKFVLSLEGNDVATNLKWIMCSNSLAVTPKLKMETWYMEGTLIPNEHYVQIADNYSDLEERLQYYIDHPNEAKLIIENAKEFRAKFSNQNLEDLIALLVLKKYFNLV
ncbi:Glycosyl transferase family 90 [Soonwooa buanensis]|uniref:Glycosyl transferase family 90 n=1 Tax=Soonwooa buanensis TaxID=619805 RepID=A0A1T5FLL9_9FLAO|nr:glycosyltransferase family 90 protein [Soonwooa buanensis]SKB97101.1 Glycosyl transferase family 90 [Soonwooa buanensis]